MKKQFAILAILVTLANCVAAQNLVPNPGFEEYDSCQYWVSVPGFGFPVNIAFSPGYSDFPTVLNWVTPLYQNTPDYFNICDTTSLGHGVPNNCFGFQEPHFGNAYVGLCMYVHENTSYIDYL